MTTGYTRLTAVIGSPVRHSLSPTIYNAAFAALDLDWTCVALEVGAGEGRDALAAMRTLGIEGLSVTMPHKDAAFAAVDELSDTARALGSVNCVARDGGRLIGHNTDGQGFLDGLTADAGFDVTGRSCAVLGAGGAARAVIDALARGGAASVAVINRTVERAEVAAALAGAVGSVADIDIVSECDLVVNATSVGMADDGLPLDAGLLRPHHLVADLIYHPAETPLMVAARAAGATAHNGLSMLIGQAAYQFRVWTGQDAPVSAMTDAAMSALSGRAAR